MKQINLFAIILLSIILLTQCAEDGKKWVKAPVNPNGDSELALVMRAIYEHSDAIKKELANGKLPSQHKIFEEIHTAVATQPEEVGTELYRTMADNYLASVKKLNTSNLDNYQQHFNAMVDNCMSCHAAICPGPRVKIKKLYIGRSKVD